MSVFWDERSVLQLLRSPNGLGGWLLGAIAVQFNSPRDGVRRTVQSK